MTQRLSDLVAAAEGSARWRLLDPSAIGLALKSGSLIIHPDGELQVFTPQGEEIDRGQGYQDLWNTLRARLWGRAVKPVVDAMIEELRT